MTAKIISLRDQGQRGVATQIAPRWISRHEALRRLIAAVARANALGAGAVTEENIAIMAEFDLFSECGGSSRSRSEHP